MSKLDSELDRLLRAAADARHEERNAEAPFGFDTRVVAKWRAQGSAGYGESWEFARLIRRLAFGAAMLTAFASAGAFWQFQQNDDFDDATVNAYAIADNVIEAGTWR